MCKELWDALKSQDIKIPIGDRAVSVTISHTGWKASITFKDLSEFIVREYLGQIVPASALTRVIENFVKIDFKSKAVVKKDYIKPKREGLTGLGLSLLDNASSGLEDVPSGSLPLPVGRMVEAMTRGLERRKPTDPVRSYAFKIVGDVTVTPKTEYVPLRGHLKVACEVSYCEYADRIEFNIGEILVLGGIQYFVDIERTRSYTVLRDPFGLANQMPRGGTPIEGPIPMVEEERTDTLEIKGVGKIKTLTLKESFTPVTLVLNSDGSFRRLRSDIAGRRLFMGCWMLLLFLLHTEIFVLT